MILHLVEQVLSQFPNLNLSRVKIIGVQHILETTHAMFNSLFSRGLKAENVFLVGKCYSTCEEVYHEMRADGIYVCPSSLKYCSHTDFDSQFEKNVNHFIDDLLDKVPFGDADLLVVLDDGGKCITALETLSNNLSVKVVGIEQTTAGYEHIKNKKLSYPVINVARSPAKLEHESPLIATAAVDRFNQSLSRLEKPPKKCLIIGGGAIGKAIYKNIRHKFDVDIYDANPKHSHIKDQSLISILKNYDCIIGCTGRTSITRDMYPYISPKTSLISVSSSDREFDAVHLRRQLSKIVNCRQDLNVNDFFLVNSGFPVNFDGERENIDPELIQLTIALITAGIVQATKTPSSLKGIISLNELLESRVVENYLEVSKLVSASA